MRHSLSRLLEALILDKYGDKNPDSLTEKQKTVIRRIEERNINLSGNNKVNNMTVDRIAVNRERGEIFIGRGISVDEAIAKIDNQAGVEERDPDAIIDTPQDDGTVTVKTASGLWFTRSECFPEKYEQAGGDAVIDTPDEDQLELRMMRARGNAEKRDSDFDIEE